MTKISLKSGKTRSWFAVLFIFIMGFIFTLQPITIFADSKVMIGDNIPDFVLEDADGKQYSPCITWFDVAFHNSFNTPRGAPQMTLLTFNFTYHFYFLIIIAGIIS